MIVIVAPKKSQNFVSKSTLHSPLSTLHSPLSTPRSPLPTPHSPLSTFLLFFGGGGLQVADFEYCFWWMTGLTGRVHTFIILSIIYYKYLFFSPVKSRTNALSSLSCFCKCLIMNGGFLHTIPLSPCCHIHPDEVYRACEFNNTNIFVSKIQ